MKYKIFTIITTLFILAFSLYLGQSYLVTLDSVYAELYKPTSTQTPEIIKTVTPIPTEIIYGEFWLEESGYYEMFKDGILSDEEIEFLYKVYYTPLPKAFVASGTRFGSDDLSCLELYFYGEVIRAEMVRGWVLVGSGEYGYHPELTKNLSIFIQKYYNYKNKNNILLDKESSPLYEYFADGGLERSRRDERNQPIPLIYSQLNERQKRIYDLTKPYGKSCKEDTLMEIEEQSLMTGNKALATKRYISLVSGKSPNDIGRRFFIYDTLGGAKKFLGVVLVAGTAKRSDWTGYGDTTSEIFQWNFSPLGLQEEANVYWAFDLPNTLYYYLGGDGGLVYNILAIDADR